MKEFKLLLFLTFALAGSSDRAGAQGTPAPQAQAKEDETKSVLSREEMAKLNEKERRAYFTEKSRAADKVEEVRKVVEKYRKIGQDRYALSTDEETKFGDKKDRVLGRINAAKNQEEKARLVSYHRNLIQKYPDLTQLQTAAADESSFKRMTEGSGSPPAVNANSNPGTVSKEEAKRRAALAKEQEQASQRGAGLDNVNVPHPIGEDKGAKPVEEDPSPNQDLVAGSKTGTHAGLMAFILGTGPYGILLSIAIGLFLGLGMSRENNK